MPVLYGVFLHMGVTALNSIQVREGCTGRGCWWGPFWGGGGLFINSCHCTAEPGFLLCVTYSLARSCLPPGQGGREGPFKSKGKGKAWLWDAEEQEKLVH